MTKGSVLFRSIDRGLGIDKFFLDFGDLELVKKDLKDEEDEDDKKPDENDDDNNNDEDEEKPKPPKDERPDAPS